MAVSGDTSCSLRVATILVVAAFMGQTCHGRVLGSRASPFTRICSRPNMLAGPNEFRLNSDIAGNTTGGSSVMDHFSKRSSSSDYDIPSVEQSSNDETSFQLCGRALDKVIRFVCRQIAVNRGRRSADEWLSSIISPEDHKVHSRAKRNVRPSDICCQRRCTRSELIQFCWNIQELFPLEEWSAILLYQANSGNWESRNSQDTFF